MDYGAEERIITLTPLGRSLGFTTLDIGMQIRAALDGIIVQKFARGDEEVIVRLSRPDIELVNDDIGEFQLIDKSGNYIYLDEVASIDKRLGFDVVRRQNGSREIAILGDLDEAIFEYFSVCGGNADISDAGINIRSRIKLQIWWKEPRAR